MTPSLRCFFSELSQTVFGFRVCVVENYTQHLVARPWNAWRAHHHGQICIRRLSFVRAWKHASPRRFGFACGSVRGVDVTFVNIYTRCNVDRRVRPSTLPCVQISTNVTSTPRTEPYAKPPLYFRRCNSNDVYPSLYLCRFNSDRYHLPLQFHCCNSAVVIFRVYKYWDALFCRCNECRRQKMQ